MLGAPATYPVPLSLLIYAKPSVIPSLCPVVDNGLLLQAITLPLDYVPTVSSDDQ